MAQGQFQTSATYKGYIITTKLTPVLVGNTQSNISTPSAQQITMSTGNLAKMH